MKSDISDQLWCVQNYGRLVLVFGRIWNDAVPRLGIVTGRSEMAEDYVHVHIFNNAYDDVWQKGMEPVTAQPNVHMLPMGHMPVQIDQFWAYDLIRPMPIDLQTPPTIVRNKGGRPRKQLTGT